MKDEGQLMDWLHLPSEITETDLWACLHDGDLRAIGSDFLKRVVRLDIDIGYLQRFHNLPEGVIFAVVLKGVQSARLAKTFPWPGVFSVPDDASRSEAGDLIAQYHAKFHEESISWTDFERELNAGKIEVRISSAIFANGSGRQCALKLGLTVDDYAYAELSLRSEGLDIARSDGQQIDLQAFLRLGEAYWEDFAARSERLMEKATVKSAGS